MLRWHPQEGRPAIPKSVKPARIAAHLDVFDFEIADDELARTYAWMTSIPTIAPSESQPAQDWPCPYCAGPYFQ